MAQARVGWMAQHRSGFTGLVMERREKIDGTVRVQLCPQRLSGEGACAVRPARWFDGAHVKGLHRALRLVRA